MLGLDRSESGAVHLLPLGGLGEIGMNLMVLIYKNEAILIDCGIMFPDAASALGVDLIVPDIRYLKESGIEVKGIVLTHGHEDHIGAVAFLIHELKWPPIYGTPFTLALVESRLKEQGRLDEATLVPVKVPATFKVGPFSVQSIQVTHSIVESMGLVIETPVGKIVHTGDFKMDPDPVDGKRIDEDTLRKIGDEGVLLVMSDSTNVERPGWSKPEAIVTKTLDELLHKIQKGKIIVAVFASNIHRIQTLLQSARRVGRRVAFAGRSIYENVEIAKQLELLKFDAEQLISLDQVEDYPPEKVLLIATGTQAEPRSALYRASLNDHPQIKIHPGDTIIMSSRFIPGNEKAISHLMNNLYRRGADVIDAETAHVHASGHAHQEEQKALLEWTRPKYFLPVHGEYRMLIKHLKLAKTVLPKVEGLVAENGDLLELTRDSFRRMQKVPFGKVFLDEASSDLPEDLLRDRRQMANTGLVVVSLVVDHQVGKILQGPDFDIRGVNDEIDLESLRGELLKRFHEFSYEARTDEIEVEEEFRRVTRRFFRKATGIKPVVIPLVYEV